MRNHKIQRRTICLTCPELAGGIGRVIVNLANEFSDMGFRVHLLLERPVGPFLKLLRVEIQVISLPSTHQISGIPFLISYLLRHRPSVLITPVVQHTVLALLARRITRVKTMIFPTVHSTYSRKFENLKASKRIKRLNKIRKYYPQCDGIICVSGGVKEDFCSLTGIHPELITTIYNPVVNSQLYKMAEEPVEHPWFNAGQPPVIISVGRLEEAKNFSLLIDTFEIVRKRKRSRLVIVGEGSERKALEQLISSSPHQSDIQLVGNQNNPYKFVKRAKLFVLTSFWEGLPTVLIEALALGTPVVSTDCPSGPREILENGRFGPLVPIGTATDLAESILKILDHPTPSNLLVDGADRFNAHHIGTKYLGLFGFSTS